MLSGTEDFINEFVMYNMNECTSYIRLKILCKVVPEQVGVYLKLILSRSIGK